jgi:hypothetical protein
VLFGDVGEVQEVGEGARDRERGVDRHGAQLAAKRFEPVGGGLRAAAGPSAFREGAHALDPLEERLAFMAPQRFAEQSAQQSDIVAQRLMGIVMQSKSPPVHILARKRPPVTPASPQLIDGVHAPDA